MEEQQPTVAVIGLGSQGLVTLKNLLEEGFVASGFDKRSYVGGVWHYSTDYHVSALQSTVVNVSRERACFTDFAFPEKTSSYPSAREVDQYLNDYCNHFGLRKHIRLSTEVKSIERDEVHNKWRLSISASGQASETLEFDKIVLATGPHVSPVQPTLAGRSHFSGTVIHSIAFKHPPSFQGKRVMVVGMSNSAADTATSLVGIAEEIFLSHRHGSVVLPRYLRDGTSLDHNLSYRQSNIKDTLDVIAPKLGAKFIASITGRISRENFGQFDPEWNLNTPPSLLHQAPTVSDTLIPALRNGSIISTAAPSHITGPNAVQLEDGKIVYVDAIIYCTGYEVDYSILGRYDPTLTNPTVSEARNKATPRLYQNVFSLTYPESLAFVGIAIAFSPAFMISDLTSMAIAQIWSTAPHTPALPARRAMEQWYEGHLVWADYLRSLSPHRKFVPLMVKNGPWLKWVEHAAGTRLEENLSYTSLQAWRFWWNDKKFCAILTDGIWSPHMYRLFESGQRKKWENARAAIEAVNTNIQERIRTMKESHDGSAI
ncbi:uncharacterized protein A1O9_05145 [Exophiala aquamarina CBS 119918]|uniref:Dimethylaniline monooxygenase (N-oxide forming) n=1 Tax=Exophiala aquamarina CBS 119918 TaxID=1182545 RepID=A0A072PJP4_9EURO|nr:uncharacterized protein A1O9_05145 [Exophiala aquamarina CBS 119918]KEF60294.1 hypothetical protein A1O9_05145 [Exophiala aquamarina CBS 119918]